MLTKKRSLSLSFVALTLALAAGLGSQLHPGQASSTGSTGSANNSSTSANSTTLTPRMAALNYSPSTDTTGATGAKEQPYETGSAVMHDVSKPLRDMGTIAAPAWTTPREMPEPKGADGASAGPVRPQISDPVVQSGYGSGSPVMAPATIKSFAGLTNRDGVYPPDTNGDVGPNNFVQWVNSSIQMFDKNGNTVYGPSEGNVIWSGFGGPCQTSNAGDPIVLYDSMADRWLLAQFTASNPYGECVAVSTTGDPTGSYYRYFFQFSTTTFYDYPKLGVWPDGYYMSANRFLNGQTYAGPSAIVFNRNSMLTGGASTFQAFNLTSSYGTLLPSDLDGKTPPPSGAVNVFASISTNALQLWKFHVDWANSANSTFAGPTSLTVAAYNQLCPSTRSCVPQPSTLVGLDALGDRLMHRLAYRNFGTYESLVVTHNVNAASSGIHAATRWYEVRNPAGSPSIYQQGTFAPDATNRWLGSVAQDASGDLGIVYTASSSSVYPSIRYSGRVPSDALGTLEAESVLKAGSGSQTGTGYRWGDYAQITVDPVDDCTFWMTNEYVPTTGTASWATWIGSFKFANCSSGPQPTATNTSVPVATNTPANTPTKTPTNVPGATNTPTKTPTNTPVPPTATNTPVPSGCGEALTNGGFESGSSPWVETSTGGYEIVDPTRPHTGVYSAYLDGYNNAVDTIYQQVTIPSNATSATLSYWYYMSTQETGSTKYDYLYAQVLNSGGGLLATLQTVSNADTKNTWKQSSFNLLAYKGQTVRIYFKGTTDSSLVTSFFVDDVSLNICH